MRRRVSIGHALGLTRAAVGVAMLGAPQLVVDRSDAGPGDESYGTLTMLTRTIGVRDLVLGMGTLAAAMRVGSRGTEADLGRWLWVTLASDVIDVLVGAASVEDLGRAGAFTAAVMPIPLVVAEVWALAETR
jgi:hypothetical protein